MKHSKKQKGKKTTIGKSLWGQHTDRVQEVSPGSGALNSDKKFKKIFFISLAAMLALLWVSGYNVGYHVDEMDMNNYCKNNFKFYFSGGKVTSFRDAGASNNVLKRDTLLRYYGSAFDYLPVGFNKITSLDKGSNEFNSRHIFNQFFAVLAFYFPG